jgi:hypothetical protein
MDFPLSKFEAARIEYAEDAFMAPCINAGWAKLDTYYTLTESVHLLTLQRLSSVLTESGTILIPPGRNILSGLGAISLP